MIIDVFNHFFPKSYFQTLQKMLPCGMGIGARVCGVPAIHDLEARFRVLDQFDDYVQVICLPNPPLEAIAEPDLSPQLARAANDGMAELVAGHPDRFIGFVASLPLNNPDASLAETDRAISELGASGIQMFTNMNGKPLDIPELKPLFAKMHQHDLPIWIHPARGSEFSDYAELDRSQYEIWWTFGWPYETSVMMAHLVFAGYFDDFPGLKIITHHMGGMVPYFEGRVGPGWDQMGCRSPGEDLQGVIKGLMRPHQEYFREFYADTALFGSNSATQCGLDFFGANRVLFGTDCPFDPEQGPGYIRETIRVLDELKLTKEDHHKICEGNARRIMRI